MKIAIIGAGYVGLVSGVGLANIGHQVFCVDKDKNKIANLKNGIIPIYEPDLEKFLQRAQKEKKIIFTNKLAEIINEVEAVFIAVGTPLKESDGSADLSCVYEVANEIAQTAQTAKKYLAIITKSTVPIGTGAQIKKIIKQTNSQLEFSIISNPEFLREGQAIADFMNPDRIVIGCEDAGAKKIMAEIYDFWAKKSVPIIYCDITSAEMIKYAANSFLATKVAFINEIANLCEKVGGDIKKISLALGLDLRIGNKFLNPGPGFGGSCFPKDIIALNQIAFKHNIKLSIIDAVINGNQARKNYMVEKIISACGGNISGKIIAVLGLAFKAGTDDVRYSPAIEIIKTLLKRGAKIQVFDPQAMQNGKKILDEKLSGDKKNKKIIYCANSYEAADGADALVIATEWEEFSKLDLAKLKERQNQSVIIDLRNILEAEKVTRAGFKYIFIGQKYTTLA